MNRSALKGYVKCISYCKYGKNLVVTSSKLTTVLTLKLAFVYDKTLYELIIYHVFTYDLFHLSLCVIISVCGKGSFYFYSV